MCVQVDILRSTWHIVERGCDFDQWRLGPLVSSHPIGSQETHASYK